jgi:hypothetical protein
MNEEGIEGPGGEPEIGDLPEPEAGSYLLPIIRPRYDLGEGQPMVLIDLRGQDTFPVTLALALAMEIVQAAGFAAADAHVDLMYAMHRMTPVNREKMLAAFRAARRWYYNPTDEATGAARAAVEENEHAHQTHQTHQTHETNGAHSAHGLGGVGIPEGVSDVAGRSGDDHAFPAASGSEPAPDGATGDAGGGEGGLSPE